MNGAEQVRHRSVTERLDARLAAIEPLVDRMMHNGDALYQGHEANAARITTLEGRLAAHALDIHQLQTQRRVFNGEDRVMALEYFKTCSTFWQRLRWLVRGV
jgi:hypothetical protein